MVVKMVVRPIAKLSTEAGRGQSQLWEMSRRVGVRAAQKDPDETSQASQECRRGLFHEINSVRLKTVKEDMHADRVSAAPR